MTAIALQLPDLRLPRITREAVVRALRAGLAPLKAEPPARLGDWAADNFYLSPEGSHKSGEWRAWPFQIALLDWMGDDSIEELNLQKSKRVGYTKMLLAFMAYCAAHRRRKLALWQPTDDDRDSFVKSEVEPMLRDVKALESVIATAATQDTIKLKSFLGSVWHLLGGKAARAYRRITVAVALLDEIDGFDRKIEKSSDPFTLAWGRLEGAPFPKLVAGTTPRTKGLSHIEDRTEQAQAHMRFNIACPHCGVEHPMLWGGKSVAFGFKWESGLPQTARHVCPHCHGSISQADYFACWEAGAWIDAEHRYRYGVDRVWRTGTGEPCRAPRHVAAHVWAIYSPQRTWESIAREHTEAEVKLKAGEDGPMAGFVNETRGETWELQGDSADEHLLSKRAEVYEIGTVPVGCLILFAGLDVQDDRVECVVWGFGAGEEMWVIDYKVFPLNPAVESEWEAVDEYLDTTRFPQAWHGGRLAIEAETIDTGGHFTHQVYYWVRKRVSRGRKTYAGRGGNKDGQPIKGPFTPVDIRWNGQKIRNGARLYEIGTDTAKDLIYGRLQVPRPLEPGVSMPGCVHFPTGLPQKFYSMLTAEMRVLVKTPTGEKSRWIKVRPRNETLDCTVYCLFAAHMHGIHVWTERQWRRLLERVQPPPDLFTPSPNAPAARAPELEHVGGTEVVPIPPARPPSMALPATRDW
jgi:phage terminase large subunit GpA-like protein